MLEKYKIKVFFSRSSQSELIFNQLVAELIFFSGLEIFGFYIADQDRLCSDYQTYVDKRLLGPHVKNCM